MSDLDRLTAMTQLIRDRDIKNQTELKDCLDGMGFSTTQSSISRDLKKIGVVKVGGYYKTPSIAPGESNKVDRLDATTAGDHMIILRTGPGNANRAAVIIDRAAMPEVSGTIAGDDTIFLAVANKNDQGKVIRKIFTLFH